MIDEILYYTITATLISFTWLILTGYRPQGESRSASARHLAVILLISALVYFIWQRDLGLTALFSIGYASLCGLIWHRLPDWNSRGHAFLVAFAAAQLVFLGRILLAIFLGNLAAYVIICSLILFSAEGFAVLLTLYFAFEVLDVMTRFRWQRFFPPYTAPNEYWPKVSIHVPAHAEPPEMVIKTLTALRNLDYPSYEVIMVDDNTTDDELWRPVLDFCFRNGIKIFHLQNYPGFKSGALNFALSQTAPDVEVIAVVDSDYLVQSNFLRETVPYFSDSSVAFVQTPQAFYNSEDNLFAYLSALAQRFFFEVSMRSRNEQNAIIFCGTMGLVRKRVLERIGGWDEWCITEDAEASLRMLQKGYQSVYINQPYGYGLLPTTFEATKKQRFRWAFGGIQILIRYSWQLLAWSTAKKSAMLSFQQRIRYLMGLLGWFNDLLLLVFTGFLLLTSAAFVYGWQLPIRLLTEWILFIPVISIITGIVRVAWALRLTTGCPRRSGLGAFMCMLALSWTVAQACLKALWNDEGTFLRTPKYGLESDLTRALKATAWETSLGILLVASMILVLNERTNREGMLLAILLAWHAIIYLSPLRFALIEALPIRKPRKETLGSALMD